MKPWLLHELHYSWLIAWLSMGIIVGIALAIWVHMPPLSLWAWVSVLSACLVVACIRHSNLMIPMVIVAGTLLGLCRGSIEQTSLALYKPFYGKAATVSGVVSEDTSYGPGGDQRIMLKNIVINHQSMHGKIWISSDNEVALKRSDTITIQGKLGTGFASIVASMYHAKITAISRPQPGDLGLRARDWFAGAIRTAIPEPEASLASGYLVGQRSTLPEDLDNQLKITGLTHAVVASGYNLTILVSFARQFLLGVSKYLATLSAAGMIAGFIMISGLSPSMSRAGLVTSLSLAAWYYGRKIHPLVLLPFAAGITALINPAYVWGDIGWYLSFASFAGVIILAPLIQHYLWGDKKRIGAIRQVLIDTMSAQLATLPIMIFAFGHYSPYALLANVLVLPLIPITMLLTFGAGVAGLVLPSVAHWFGLPATLLLRYMIAIVARIANLPGAQGDLTIGIGILAALYVVIIAMMYVLWRKTRLDFRAEPEAVHIAENPTA